MPTSQPEATLDLAAPRSVSQSILPGARDGDEPMMKTEFFDINCDGQLISVPTKLRFAGDHLVIFMHGFGCAKECFDGVFDTDDFRDLSICTFDFPGHGQSKRSDISMYSLQSYADLANTLIGKIAPKAVSMVCHSMGGAVGIIASQECQNLKTFINVEGNLVAQDCGIVSRSTADQSLEEFKAQGFQEFLQALESSGGDDDMAWARWYAQADPSALHQTARSLVEWSDSGKLLDLFKDLPDQVYMYGENDRKDYLVPELQGIATYRVPNSGHFVMLDNPQVFYTLVSKLLHRDANMTEDVRKILLSRVL